MLRFIIVSVISGVLFAAMDAVIHANPLAQRLYEIFKPLARKSFNPLAGLIIDLVLGFAMAGVFLLLYDSLPGEAGLVKGLSYALLLWFFRVVMYSASQWVMFALPVKTILYTLLTGLAEMLVLGLFYGLTLRPAG